MNATTRTMIIALIVIIIIVFLGLLAWNERGGNTAPSSASSTVATSTSVGVTVSSSTQQGSYTITQVPIGNSTIKEPNYKAPLAFSGDVSADERASLQTQFATAQTAIAANANDANAWIALGDARKEAGDYSGAAADWTYVSEIAPTNIVSFANLGDLYMNFLPDYSVAVQNFKQEIKNNPQDPYIYDDLYQLYTHQYPEPKATIVAMLQAGLAANPGNATLQADLDAAQAQ